MKLLQLTIAMAIAALAQSRGTRNGRPRTYSVKPTAIWKDGTPTVPITSVYTIDKVEWHLDLANVIKKRPKELGYVASVNPLCPSKRNCPVQEMAFRKEFVATSTHSFEITGGLELNTGFTLSTGMPYLLSGELRLDAGFELELTHGYERETSELFRVDMPCKAAPGTVARCKFMLHEAILDVPVTIHYKYPPNYKTEVVYKGVTQYNGRVEVEYEAI